MVTISFRPARYDDIPEAEARILVFNYYGWYCACCGSNTVLTIDHVNGDGKEHRKKLSKSHTTLYRWLVKRKFPPGFQTLCRSCNSSKGAWFYGSRRCPQHLAYELGLNPGPNTKPFNPNLIWLEGN